MGVGAREGAIIFLKKYRRGQSGIEGKEGNIWIGSISGEGLYKINPETEELSYFNKQNGLASENVYSIALDKGGDIYSRLWRVDANKNAMGSVEHSRHRSITTCRAKVPF